MFLFSESEKLRIIRAGCVLHLLSANRKKGIIPKSVQGTAPDLLTRCGHKHGVNHSKILYFCCEAFCPEQPNCSKGGVHFDKNESLYDLNFIPEDVRHACGFAASVCVCVV